MRTFSQFNRQWERRARRQSLVHHLMQCGARPVLEAFIEVSHGTDLDDVLESYAGLSPALFKAMCADEFEHVGAIDGGRQ